LHLAGLAVVFGLIYGFSAPFSSLLGVYFGYRVIRLVLRFFRLALSLVFIVISILILIVIISLLTI
jgi:hypothetical protein